MSDLYLCRTHNNEYTITKLTADYEPIATYELSPRSCTCPAGFRPSCRHREMLPTFLAAGHVDDGTFYNYDLKTWLPPLTMENEDE